MAFTDDSIIMLYFSSLEYTLPGIYITSIIYLYKLFVIYISLAVFKFQLFITKYRNYKDPLSGWSETTKGWSYGRKCHMSIDVDSLLINEWILTRGNIHDSSVSHEMIDSVRNYGHILADSAYDTSEIYDYIFENAHSLPVIDTNKRRGIINDRLTVNRKVGIELRNEYSSMYSMRWEIERTFSILEGIMGCENIWYVSNRDYDNIIGLKAIAYNLMVISNIELGYSRREIMKIVSC